MGASSAARNARISPSPDRSDLHRRRRATPRTTGREATLPAVSNDPLFSLSPTTQLHIDGWAFDTEPSGGAHTIWFPLEEIIFDQGPVCVAEWKLGNVLSASDMGIKDFPGELARDGLGTYKRYHDGLNCEIERRAVTLHVPQLRLGDAVVFASLTPHGSVPARGNQKFRRMAVQAIVAPAGEPLGVCGATLVGNARRFRKRVKSAPSMIAGACGCGRRPELD